MPKLKIYVHYEESSKKEEHMVLKFVVPKKWVEGPTSKIKEFFVAEYNKKHADSPLDASALRIARKTGSPLDATIVKDAVQRYDDLYITAKAKASSSAPHHFNDKGLYVPATVDKFSTKPRTEKSTTTSAASSFDAKYRKFDNLVCSSDDDEDCHPNIEKMTWRRLRKKQREDKRAEQEKRIAELKELTSVSEAAIADAQIVLDSDDKSAHEKATAEIAAARASIDAYAAEIASIKRKMKLTLEDVCTVTDERTIVSANANVTPVPTVQKKEDEASALESFIKSHDDELTEYITYARRSYRDNREFLESRPQLLCEQCTGWLLLRSLEAEMDGDGARMKDIVKQYLQLQTVMDLSKSTRKDPRDFIVRFFHNLDRDPKNREKFDAEVEDFAKKIRKRAADKKREAEKKEALADELGLDTQDGKYEYVELSKEERMGPGGLDPVEVFKTLPKAMQNAFDTQDIPLLQKVIAEMPPDQAAYHMKRCADSGLWVPAGEKEGDGGKATAAGPPRPPSV